MAFHWRDGWYFKRLHDGSVLIEKLENPSDDFDNPLAKVDTTIVIPPFEWCSILCAVSRPDESSQEFEFTKRFHRVVYDAEAI